LASGYDENDIGLTDLSALDLVSGFTVLPHFTERQFGVAQAWSKESRQIVLGIPERSGVTLRDGQAEVVGADPAWEVAGAEVTVRAPGERWTVSAV
jgi:hypothetical protein